jgi:hypothetical protein
VLRPVQVGVEQTHLHAVVDDAEDARLVDLAQLFRADKGQVIIPPHIIAVTIDVTEQQRIDSHAVTALTPHQLTQPDVLIEVDVQRVVVKSSFACSSHIVTLKFL